MAEDHVNSPTEYQLMEEELTSSTEKIYILSASSLPSHIRSSHIRSVEVKHNTYRTELSELCCSSRSINIILILVFVLVTSLTISIVVYKITEISDTGNRLQSIFVHKDNSSKEPQALVLTTETDNSTSAIIESDTTQINLLKSRQCSHKCQLYKDKKFQSDCVYGRCVCRGENYQFLTCLPSVGQCVVSRGSFPFVNFTMGNVSIPVYMCRPDTNISENDLYILALYGNHYAKSTVVDVIGKSRKPVTLVLASYYPIIWQVRNQEVKIQKIILISHSNIESSDVEILQDTLETEEMNRPTPSMTAMQIPVGFGNDINESKTVEMLKILSGRVGTVRTFAGADYSDYISLQVEDQ